MYRDLLHKLLQLAIVGLLYLSMNPNDLTLPNEDKGGGVPNIPSISHHDSKSIFSQNTSSSIRQWRGVHQPSVQSILPATRSPP
jgi:hypothetical protein